MTGGWETGGLVRGAGFLRPGLLPLGSLCHLSCALSPETVTRRRDRFLRVVIPVNFSSPRSWEDPC